MTSIKKVRDYEEDAYTETHYEIVSDGQTVGYASVQHSDGGAYMDRIDIDEAFRNRGIGSDAIQQIARLYDDGIYLAPDNEDARRLYERLGRESSRYDAPYIDQGFGVYDIW